VLHGASFEARRDKAQALIANRERLASTNLGDAR